MIKYKVKVIKRFLPLYYLSIKVLSQGSIFRTLTEI